MNKLRSANPAVVMLLALLGATPAWCACLQTQLPSDPSTNTAGAHQHGVTAEHHDDHGEFVADCVSDCAEPEDHPLVAPKPGPDLPAPDAGSALHAHGADLPTRGAAHKPARPLSHDPPAYPSRTLVALKVLLLI